MSIRSGSQSDQIAFDIRLRDGTPVGAMPSVAVPAAGDVVRTDSNQPVYVVVRREFGPLRVAVIVRSVDDNVPDSGFRSGSPFARQAPGAGGFT